MGTSGRDWLAVRPPSLASHASTGNGYIWKRLVGCQAAIAGKPCFYRNGYIWKRLVGCQAAIASRLAPTIGPGPSVRDWLAVRPPSLASQAPTGNGYIWKRLVGCQAAIAGKPSSYREWVHLEEIGRLSGRHRWQAKLLQGMSTPAASHHSTGRALARLPLLILIHPPLREAEWRCSSGEGAQRRSTQSNTLHVGRSEADRRAVSPEGYRSEGTPSPSEGPDARGEPFFAYFFLAFEKKVSRRKGETLSGRYRRNGYVHNPQKHGRPKGRQVQKLTTTKKNVSVLGILQAKSSQARRALLP